MPSNEKRSDVSVDQGRSADRLLDELASGTPLADPAVVAVVSELTAEIGRLRAATGTEAADGSAPGVEALTALLLGQAAELQDLRERLQRVRALIDLSSWAAGGGDPTVRVSDIRHAIGGPLADRAE